MGSGHNITKWSLQRREAEGSDSVSDSVELQQGPGPVKALPPVLPRVCVREREREHRALSGERSTATPDLKSRFFPCALATCVVYPR